MGRSGGWDRQSVWHVGFENDDEESIGFFSGSERKCSQRKQVKEKQLEKGFSTKTSFQRSYTAALRRVAAVS
jgi:hypothetical protein